MGETYPIRPGQRTVHPPVASRLRGIFEGFVTDATFGLPRG